MGTFKVNGDISATGNVSCIKTGARYLVNNNALELWFGINTDGTAWGIYNNTDGAYIVKQTSSATTFYGNASTATKLATARTIRTNLASTSTASFDGSANIAPGVTGTLAVGNGGTGKTSFSAGYLIQGNGSSALTTTNAHINYSAGTTSTAGYEELVLGNSTKSGTTGNTYGRLALYSSSSAGVYLTAAATTGWSYTSILPLANGTLLNTGNYSSYALPLSGGAMTGNISYANGSYGNYEMIKFITGDDNGAGIVIGGGGLAVFGSGESASNLVTAASLGGNAEETHITSDGTIYFHTNCQTIAKRKTVSINASGAFSGTIAWGNVTDKPSSYTPAAHTNHATLTITSKSASAHLAFSRANLNYVTCPASGYLGFSMNGQGTSLAVCDLVVADGSVYPGSNNATTLGSSSYRWSTVHTQRLIAYNTADAGATAKNAVALITGDPSGQHIEFDGNEIISKTNATTGGVLYINSGGAYTQLYTIGGEKGQTYGPSLPTAYTTGQIFFKI